MSITQITEGETAQRHLLMAMTEERERLEKQLELQGSVLRQVTETLLTVTAERDALKAALEKLARLGNEPHYGNSDGNVIARAALEGKS